MQISTDHHYIKIESKALGRAIALQSRTKLSGSPHKSSHPIFLEPEGRHSSEFYVNGISTSLPFDVQLSLVRSIPGLEGAEIIRPGYAVEDHYFPPTQLHPTLETKLVENLYFAGQINGTSGYERSCRPRRNRRNQRRIKGTRSRSVYAFERNQLHRCPDRRFDNTRNG